MSKFQVTFKGEFFDVTVSGESSREIVENYKSIKQELVELLPARFASRIEPRKGGVFGIVKKEPTNTLPSKIIQLVEDRFFDKSRKLQEVQEALRKNGLIKPATTISARLMELVRKGTLEREYETLDDKKQWVYRKPEQK